MGIIATFVYTWLLQICIIPTLWDGVLDSRVRQLHLLQTWHRAIGTKALMYLIDSNYLYKGRNQYCIVINNHGTFSSSLLMSQCEWKRR